MVQKLETALYIPEDVIVKQDEETFEMYFIAKGECFVNVRDQDRHECENFKKLYEGEHFGEIAMIYKCRRSASVLSKNYNTMARLGEDQYKNLISEFPDYNKFLKQNL